jgi:hypothetical protein
MRRRISAPVLAWALVILGLAATLAATPAGALDLQFGGMAWGIRKTAGPTDPGPNTFESAPDHIWVDAQGALHLTLKKKGEVWYATEAMAKKDTGYGTYRFELSGSAGALDPNIVFGFFTWDRNTPPYNRELDIEISKWGDPAIQPLWFTVQPYDVPGRQASFALPPAKRYSFEMRWEPGSVSYQAWADGVPLASWKFSGDVPEPGRARLRLNMWLFRGKAPAGTGPYEVVVSNFSFQPR